MLQSTGQQINQLNHDYARIDNHRRQLLAGIAEYVGERVRRSEVARLTFICTHNSRRSQMSQIAPFCAALGKSKKKMPSKRSARANSAGSLVMSLQVATTNTSDS